MTKTSPDPNIRWVFWYKSEVTKEGIRVSFLKGLVRILFRFENIRKAKITSYNGGRISWDVIRWGRCPKGTRALEIVLRREIFRRHLIVSLDKAVEELKKYVEVRE